MTSADTQLPIPDPEAQSLASALIRARTELGITQAQLSELSGVSRSAIKGYETGRNMPGARELRALCGTLKVSPNALLFGSETPFGDRAREDELKERQDALSKVPDEFKERHSRLIALSTMLTKDEAGSLLKLVQGLATARFGPDEVKKTILHADLMMGATFAMLKYKPPPGKEFDTEAISNDLAAYLKDRGHDIEVKHEP